ncbi:MAG: TetR family transcriptional regulator [Salinisphaeraceae bacterium]|nr:TetR family transcriptional regulator [Salinisphaeraceae bacterium]
MNQKTEPSRVYGGQSQAQRTAERREAFIDAGFELIGTEGYRAATVRAVCREAGFTDRYFYQLFGNTEGLLIAVYSRVSQQLKQALDAAEAAAEPTLEARSEAGLRTFLRFMRDPRNARILMSEILGVSDEVTKLYMRTTAEFAERLMTATVPPDVALSHTPEDAALFGQSLVGAMIYAAGAWAMNGYRQSEDSVVASCQSILVGALRQQAAQQS